MNQPITPGPATEAARRAWDQYLTTPGVKALDAETAMDISIAAAEQAITPIRAILDTISDYREHASADLLDIIELIAPHVYTTTELANLDAAPGDHPTDETSDDQPGDADDILTRSRAQLASLGKLADTEWDAYTDGDNNNLYAAVAIGDHEIRLPWLEGSALVAQFIADSPNLIRDLTNKGEKLHAVLAGSNRRFRLLLDDRNEARAEIERLHTENQRLREAAGKTAAQ